MPCPGYNKKSPDSAGDFVLHILNAIFITSILARNYVKSHDTFVSLTGFKFYFLTFLKS
jgi:hypothetical protein